MASAAISGDNNHPVNGYMTPAAMGMPIMVWGVDVALLLNGLRQASADVDEILATS